MVELWHSLIHELTLLRPFIPTYVHLLLSALFPIVAGAHASLSRPSSAAAPRKRSEELKPSESNAEDDRDPPERGHRMEGLAPSDAIVYPVLIGCTLSALFFLLKWLNDSKVLNQILNLYLSGFGVLSIAKLASDSIDFCISFVFPSTYLDQGIEWKVRNSRRHAHPRKINVESSMPKGRLSPLPGIFSRMAFPNSVLQGFWSIRSVALQPTCYVQTYVRGMTEATIPIRLPDVIGLCFSIVSVLHFNIVHKPWWLTNILGISFCYDALQVMSATTFWTGSLVLIALFAYDIYFVFFTPMMITVATSLDIPVKLLFPRPSDNVDGPQKQHFAMLGLGDIVLPGIFIGLALRFDLYMFYLRQQTRTNTSQANVLEGTEDDVVTESYDEQSGGNIVKSHYRVATGKWGERFWLGPGRNERVDGGLFPKPYFYASVVGYMFGILFTLSMMHIFEYGQPALLYLVPSVLAATWGTAFMRGEIIPMWEFTEAEEGTSEAMQDEISSHKDSVIDMAPGASQKHALGSTSPLGSNNTASTRVRDYLAYVVIRTTESVKTSSEGFKP